MTRQIDHGERYAGTSKLNRPLTLHGTLITSDVLGNRLSAGSTSYTWDVVNRLISIDAQEQWDYAYRADGMRVGRWDGDGNETLWRYDGQMPVQEVRTTETGGTTVIDSALGARGVEAYSKRVGTGAAVIGYPLYDAHGNNVATLRKDGSAWSILNTLRAYDAWGNVAGALGDPSGRYCANLGHVQDDESGLVYMRARYYEPGTGRFISEDPSRDGLNWFAYCSGDPVNRHDRDGRVDESVQEAVGLAMFQVGFIEALLGCCFPDPVTAMQEIMEGVLYTRIFVSATIREIGNTAQNVKLGLYKVGELLNGSDIGRVWKNMERMPGAKSSMGGLATRAIAAAHGWSMMTLGVGIYMGVFEL